MQLRSPLGCSKCGYDRGQTKQELPAVVRGGDQDRGTTNKPSASSPDYYPMVSELCRVTLNVWSKPQRFGSSACPPASCSAVYGDTGQWWLATRAYSANQLKVKGRQHGGSLRRLCVRIHLGSSSAFLKHYSSGRRLLQYICTWLSPACTQSQSQQNEGKEVMKVKSKTHCRQQGLATQSKVMNRELWLRGTAVVLHKSSTTNDTDLSFLRV